MRYFKNISVFIRVLAANLLCLAIVFNLSSTAFHTQLHHHSNETVCSAELDNDACHLFEVHNIKSENCDGSHDHIDSKEEDCFACKYFTQRSTDFIQSNNLLKTIHQNYSLAFPITKACVYFNYSLTNYLRGPPVLYYLIF